MQIFIHVPRSIYSNICVFSSQPRNKVEERGCGVLQRHTGLQNMREVKIVKGGQREMKTSNKYKKIKIKQTKGAMIKVQGQEGKNKMEPAKSTASRQDQSLPSVGLIAPGKLSHGRVQEGQG